MTVASIPITKPKAVNRFPASSLGNACKIDHVITSKAQNTIERLTNLCLLNSASIIDINQSKVILMPSDILQSMLIFCRCVSCCNGSHLENARPMKIHYVAFPTTHQALYDPLCLINKSHL